MINASDDALKSLPLPDWVIRDRAVSLETHPMTAVASKRTSAERRRTPAAGTGAGLLGTALDVLQHQRQAQRDGDVDRVGASGRLL